MLDYLLLILGLALLYKGADYLVEGSSSLAKRLRISSLVIGLTIVAFGTSMPELIVNVFASIKGEAAVSFGNIIGSNIFNILLILGMAAVIVPLTVKKSTAYKEIPFALLAVAVLFVMSNKSFFFGYPGNVLTLADGIIMLIFFIIFLIYILGLIRAGKKNHHEEPETKHHPLFKLILMIMGGLVALFLGGEFTVRGAVSIARQLGISELLISSTIVAAGTSLPELVTSVVAAIRKEMDISVGNIVGSNIFNIFLIMGVSAVISPLTVPSGINYDFIFLGAATVGLFAVMFIGTKRKIDRWEGITFLLMYAAYLAFLIKRG